MDQTQQLPLDFLGQQRPLLLQTMEQIGQAGLPPGPAAESGIQGAVPQFPRLQQISTGFNPKPLPPGATPVDSDTELVNEALANRDLSIDQQLAKLTGSPPIPCPCHLALIVPSSAWSSTS